MSPVFAHGRLRLYLLKLLDEAPRHGYEVIRLLEERFNGLYAPSAGTVYPRLAKLEQEGLISHTVEGGRKVYRTTAAGRDEIAARSAELTDLEREIGESVTQLADQIREDVRDSAKDLREEMNRAARESRHGGKADWRSLREELRQQERAAREEARRAREDAHALREEARRESQRIRDQIRTHVKAGDWPTGLADGLGELSRTLNRLSEPGFWQQQHGAPAAEAPGGAAAGAAGTAEDPPVGFAKPQADEAPLPEWTTVDPGGEPLRELTRLLDRFRDEVRDTARDADRAARWTAADLDRARRVLAEAAARLRR